MFHKRCYFCAFKHFTDVNCYPTGKFISLIRSALSNAEIFSAWAYCLSVTAGEKYLTQMLWVNCHCLIQSFTVSQVLPENTCQKLLGFLLP